MKQAIIALYLIAGSVLIGKLGITLIDSSSILHHSAVVAQLQSDRAMLKEQQTMLLAEQSSQTAIHALSERAKAQFEPIMTTKLVRLNTDQLAALE